MIVESAAGNNLVGLGLITHFTALMIGMSAFENSGVISVSLYLSSIVMLMGGIIIESKNRNEKVSYTACGLTIIPIIGPIGVLWLTAAYIPETSHRLIPFLRSLLTLKIHPLLLAGWIAIVLSWIGISFLTNDPYFKP